MVMKHYRYATVTAQLPKKQCMQCKETEEEEAKGKKRSALRRICMLVKCMPDVKSAVCPPLIQCHGGNVVVTA